MKKALKSIFINWLGALPVFAIGAFFVPVLATQTSTASFASFAAFMAASAALYFSFMFSAVNSQRVQPSLKTAFWGSVYASIWMMIITAISPIYGIPHKALPIVFVVSFIAGFGSFVANCLWYGSPNATPPAK
jgi:predicted membrane channel-forming protein YqfA (hemolysin III family)